MMSPHLLPDGHPGRGTAVALQFHGSPNIVLVRNNPLLMFQRADGVVQPNGNGARSLVSLADTHRVGDPAEIAAICIRRLPPGPAPPLSERDYWLARAIEQRHFT